MVIAFFLFRQFVEPRLLEAARPFLMDYVLLRLSEAERERIYRDTAESIPSFWDIVPDHLVHRLGQRGRTTTYRGAEVSINNAGMRSGRPFGPKPPSVFRIICLGDSFVFGTAGKEEDRFCDQIEDYYAEQGVYIDGKRIEAYAVGLGSWTTVQESVYLSTRLSGSPPVPAPIRSHSPEGVKLKPSRRGWLEASRLA